MTGEQLRTRRIASNIPGFVLCTKAGITRSRLSNFERGYIHLPDVEIEQIDRALSELIEAKRQMRQVAVAAGWPTASTT